MSRIHEALHYASEYGQDDGGNHKMWVIDQMCRALLSDEYDEWVGSYCDGHDGADTYEWDTGIAP